VTHIAFLIPPLSGHISPTLGVVAELSARGHKVSYAVTDEYAVRVSRAGAHCVGYLTTLRHAGDAPAGAQSFGEHFTAEDFVRAHRGQLREAAMVLPLLAGAFGKDVPDVVVCDPMWWVGRILAAQWDVPAVKSVTTLVGNSHWSIGHAYSSFDPTHPALPGLFASIAAFLARTGTNLTADRLLATEDGIPVIAYHPRAFQVEGDGFGNHVHFVGPCLSGRARSPDDGHSWRPPVDRPVTLVSLGTVFNLRPDLFGICVTALADLGRPVVLSLGGGDPSCLDPLPPNVQAHSYLPLLDVLPHADVFVSHGSLRSAIEALSSGVRIVAIPQMPEQRANADQIVRLGLGRQIGRAELNAPAVRRAVEEVSADEKVGARISRMRAEIHRAGGASLAADVIEAAASGGAGSADV
jgi:MGT family glycosyltransferase